MSEEKGADQALLEDFIQQFGAQNSHLFRFKDSVGGNARGLAQHVRGLSEDLFARLKNLCDVAVGISGDDSLLPRLVEDVDPRAK